MVLIEVIPSAQFVVLAVPNRLGVLRLVVEGEAFGPVVGVKTVLTKTGLDVVVTA